MKHYSMAHETEAHYVLHDKRDGRLFHIAKKGIDHNTSDMIKSLPKMEEFKSYDNDYPDSRNIPGTDPKPLEQQPQHYQSGGVIGNPPPDKQPEFPQQTQEERDAESEEITRSEDERKLEAEEEGKPFSEGGHVLDANARKHIAPKNFAGPDRSYPIEDISHARNALARVAQHGSPELQAQVKAKVHAKYPSVGMAEGGNAVATGGLVHTSMSPYTNVPIPNYDDGGKVPPPQTPVQSAQDSMRKAFHFDEGTPAGDVGTQAEIQQEINQPAQEPTAPQPEAPPGDVGAPSAMVQEDVAAQQAATPASQEAPPMEQSAPEQNPAEPLPQSQERIPASIPNADTIVEKAAMGQSDLDQQLAQNQADYQALVQKQQADDKRFSDLVASKKLDANRFMNDKNFGQKVAIGLSLALGGVGAGMTGTPNQALEVLNNNINRDIEAQKNDQSKAINLWKMNHESLRDQQAATLQTRNQMLEVAKVKMDELMGTAPGPMAMQKAAALRTQIQAEQMQNQFAISRSKMMSNLLNEQNGSGGATGQLSKRDPASMVPYLVSNEMQKPVFQEIQDRQNITANGPTILKAFDQAVKDKGLGSLKINPASINALHQGMLPLFKDVDGTVRQAAMDESFHNLTPSMLDSDTKVKEKRQALVDWIQSKHAAPIAKGFGIDLDKYQSTAGQVGGEIRKMNGASYQKVDGGWKKVGK